MNFAFNRQALFTFFQLRFFRYLDKKHRSRSLHRLNHKNLFIFPTRKGWLFVAVNLVLWLLGTNYQNNLVLALAFFMAALFVTCILQTYANLSRIQIRCSGASECFAGSSVDFLFSFSTSRIAAENIDLRFKGAEEKYAGLNLDGDEEVQIKIPMPTQRRGWLKADRLLIESEYPLGLLRCWTWLRFDTEALIFPEPFSCLEPKAVNIQEEGENERPIKGGEDYSGLHQYHSGDSLKHVAWKVYARGGGMHTKEFSQSVSREIWLDLQQVQGADLEQKISGLCYWALEYERREENYGLNLPGTHIPPSRGEGHRFQVLSALACFGLEK